MSRVTRPPATRRPRPLANRTILLGTLAALLLTGCAGGETSATGEADRYPTKPITWIVAFDPGGGSDLEARRVQQALEDKLKTRIQIEYRSGGGGAVGWSELVKKPADGHTVGGLVIPHVVIQPLAQEDAGYTMQDVRPIAWNVSAPAALLVRDDSRFKSLDEFLAFAKDNPGEATVGGVQTFSASDLALAQLTESAGVEVSYVPVTGGAGPLLTQLKGEHVDAVMLATSHAVQTEGIRPLAIAGDERYSGLPDVPTFKELGHDVTIRYAWGVGMPAKVPDAVAERFGGAVLEAMKDPAVEKALAKEGLEPILIGPDKARQYAEEQEKIYSELVPLVKELGR